MATALTGFFSKVINPAWLTGPIFDKELRVSSRRRRNYVLRFAYLALLTIFVAMVWLSAVKIRSQPGGAFLTSRMSLAGMAIISSIVGFQFFITQLIAVVMLSTAISDEIYNRTLGLLMTTPINSFQIVMGKLFSKLLQLILLLAISLPLLAIVRVFGGVPWNYVLSSLCITLTAIIFAGSLSLYFSINSRHAYAVILKTIFTLAFLYLFIPAMGGWLLHDAIPQRILYTALVLPNPFIALRFNTALMMSPGVAGGMFFFSWPLHCAVMLGASALLLARSVRVVRRVALQQATGQLDRSSKRRRKQNKSSARTAKLKESAGPIRRIKGSPVIWKELRAPIIQGAGGRNSIIGLAAAIIALLITYAVCIREGCLDEDFAHVSYTLVFVIIGLIVNMVLSATSITSEKEARSWPILLATSLDDWHILLGKAVGVFRRCLPIWFLLAGHTVLFVLVRYIHPVAIVHLSMLIVGLIVFLSGSGLYFSARLKRTTSAVVANFALGLVLWALIPMLLGLLVQITHDEDILEAYLSANPVVQAGIIINGASGEYNAQKTLSQLTYDWPHNRSGGSGIATTTTILLITMLVYIFAGLLFAWRAKCRFRRNIF